MKKALSLAIIAIALTFLLFGCFGTFTPQAFEQETQRITTLDEAKDRGRCPLEPSAFAADPTWLIGICADNGIGAYEAARRFPHGALRVFNLYRNVPEFTEIICAYGPDAIPVVQYFVDNGSMEMLLKETLSQMADSFAHDRQMKLALANVSPSQYGLIAIMEIKRRGHDLLSEFTIAGEDARRIQTDHVFNLGKHLLLGGIENLEIVLRRGERLPTVWEATQAAADGLILLGGAAKAVSLLRGVGKVAREEVAITTEASGLEDLSKAERVADDLEDASALSKSTRAVQVFDLVSGGARVAAIGTVAFVATHPVWTMHYAAWLAQEAGLPAWVGILAASGVVAIAFVVALPIVLPTIASLVLWLAVSLTTLCAAAGFKLFRFSMARSISYGSRAIRGA